VRLDVGVLVLMGGVGGGDRCFEVRLAGGCGAPPDVAGKAGAVATGEADDETAVNSAYSTGQDPTVYVQAHLDALEANDHVCVTSAVRRQTVADNDAWRARVARMYLTFAPSGGNLDGGGFNTGTVYIAVIRSSDSTVLWQTWISTSAGADFSVATPFPDCDATTPTSTPIYIVSYDYTAGIWRSHGPDEVCS
jgi:hypothetical protein